MQFNQPISKKIKDIRAKCKLSQERFGKKIGVSGKTISAYETGKCVPPLKVLDRISQTYDTGFFQLKSTIKDDIETKLEVLKSLVNDLEGIVLK